MLYIHLNSKVISLTIILLTTLSFIPIESCNQESPKVIEIRGVYGNPKPFWDKDLNLQDLGVNAIFVHSGSINQQMIDRARAEGLMVYAEFATLNGKNYVELHPEAWAIDEQGIKVEAATWFMGVCPTEPGFRQYRMDQLKELLLKYDLDGVWMDYVHWHAQFESPEPILPETCFCSHCLTTFSSAAGVVLPDGEIAEKAEWILNNHDKSWRDWRCQVVNNWAIDMKRIVKQHSPDALLGLYHCPWDDQEFNGARRRILGLDYDLLKETVDVFSPMVYHGRMGRDPEWVQENISWFCDQLEIGNNTYPKVWPIVQAHNDPGVIDVEAFETVLMGGLSGKSSGVMMFTTHAVAENEEKTALMKKVYTQLNPK